MRSRASSTNPISETIGASITAPADAAPFSKPPVGAESQIEKELQERALRLEARKLSLETLTRVHLENVNGTRLLVLSHQRLMFTLSLGTLAGVTTLFAAALRVQGPQLQNLSSLQTMAALVALAALTASALLSAAALQRATRWACTLLRKPFPGSDGELARVFSHQCGDETEIIASVLNVLERRVHAEPLVEPRMWGTTALLIVGFAATATAFAL